MSTKLGTIPLATKVLTIEDIDNVLAEDSNNAIANGTVYSALEEKQNKILKEPELPFPITGEHVTAVQATYSGFNLSTNAGTENQTPKLLFPVLTSDATIITSLDPIGSQTTCYVVYSLDELISIAKNKGDIAIVQKEISTGVISRTAYFWNGLNWQAMDGNYSADNVYFDENLDLNVSFGKYGSGSGTAYQLPSAGKNLKEILIDAFTASGSHGTKTPPTFSFNINSYTANGEVGTTYTIPTATLAMTSLGTYQYGTATCHDATNNTGISVEIENAYVESPEKGKTFNVAAMKNSNPVTCAAGTQSYVYGDEAATYTYNVSASYVQGDIPLDSLGAADPGNRLPPGTFTDTKTATFTGQRFKFWGYRNANDEDVLDIDNLTSENIRNGLHFNGAVSWPTTITLPKGTKQIIFAAPRDSWQQKIKLLDSLGSKLAFANRCMRVQDKVSVEGSNGYAAVPYDIWYYNMSSKLGSNMTYTVNWES